MATIFQTKPIECKLRTVEAVDDGEFFGGAEPYFWPIFYKIDGETVKAIIDIDFTSGMRIQLDGAPVVVSKAGSHGNLPSMNTGDVVEVTNANGRFRSDFSPIPVTVNVNLGSFGEELLADALVNLEELIGLIDDDRRCPPIGDIDSAELGEFAAEFISGTLGGLPGICGGTYILMEEDFTSESAAEESRRAIRDTIKRQLQDVINDLDIRIQFPMNMNALVNNLTDLLDTEEDIIDESTDTVIIIIVKDVLFNILTYGIAGAAIGSGSALLLGVAGLPFVAQAGVAGFVIGVLAGADFDDILGTTSGLITHFDDDDFNFSFAPQTSDQGKWKITGGIKFR